MSLTKSQSSSCNVRPSPPELPVWSRFLSEATLATGDDVDIGMVWALLTEEAMSSVPLTIRVEGTDVRVVAWMRFAVHHTDEHGDEFRVFTGTVSDILNVERDNWLTGVAHNIIVAAPAESDSENAELFLMIDYSS
ncbi:hypothetical protein [Tsukamurella tyrosinosolvens]|uniref:hypothetical protein n=1 Tax=Tsukamurella tyrosinosolvens TaxID=57704 RepID=UPI0011C01C89|nr:hypothetical protein [Tsukamurella tyrosinosolvens]